MPSVNFRGPYILSNSHLVQSRYSSFKLYDVDGYVGVIECLLSTSDRMTAKTVAAMSCRAAMTTLMVVV